MLESNLGSSRRVGTPERSICERCTNRSGCRGDRDLVREHAHLSLTRSGSRVAEVG